MSCSTPISFRQTGDYEKQRQSWGASDARDPALQSVRTGSAGDRLTGDPGSHAAFDAADIFRGWDASLLSTRSAMRNRAESNRNRLQQVEDEVPSVFAR